MAESLTYLCQRQPAAMVRDDAYIVPAGSSVVVSSILAANVGGSADTWSISIARGGAAHASSQVLYSGLPLAASDTFAATLGVTLQAGDVLRVMSTGGRVAFHAFGSVIS